MAKGFAAWTFLTAVSFAFLLPIAAAEEEKQQRNTAQAEDQQKEKDEEQQEKSGKSQEESEQEEQKEQEPATLAVFTLRGILSEMPVQEDFLFSSGAGESLKDLLTRMKKAREDEEVSAVVLLLENATLGYAQIQELRSSIEELKEAEKKVFVHADTLDMGNYVLASAASRVSIVPTGDIWIAGLYAETPYLRGLLDMVGVQPDFYTCGSYKSAAEIFTRKTPSEEAAENLNWLLDSIFESVVAAIAEGRDVKAEQVRQWIDEGLFTAEEAKEAGVVDAVEYRQDFVAQLKENYGDDLTFDKQYGQKDEPEIDLSSPFGIFKFYADLLAGPPKQKDSKDAVAIVYVEGPIVPGRAAPGGFPFASSAMAYSTPIREALDECADDASVKAVVLRVNSPGGSAVASEIILNATKRVAENKPLVVSMGDVAGSGGYYVACGTDTIFADPSTITGSIGVVAGKLATEGMWDKVGISFHGYQRGKNAGMLSSSRQFSESQREELQEFMNDIYEAFKNHVQQVRGPKLKKDLEELAGGRVYTGQQALELGLVDKLGGLEAAIAEAANKAEIEEYEIRVVPRPKTFIELLFADASDEKDDPHQLQLRAIGLSSRLSLLEAALPHLQKLDPMRVRAIVTALKQLELMQHEPVLMTMPPIVVGQR